MWVAKIRGRVVGSDRVVRPYREIYRRVAFGRAGRQ